jgi:effector-binding domain-containing protein
MSQEPTIVEWPAQPYAAITAQVTLQNIGEVVPPLSGEVVGWLAQRGVAPAGPPFWKYNVIDMQRGLEVEAGVTVAAAVEGDARVQPGVLPAGRYVTARHVGHPSTLIAATAALLDWAQAKGLTWDVTPSPAGDRWGCRLELYLTDPQTEPDMNRWETQLAFRLRD